ncbi:MAG: cell wall metabolism sensor histidine kinase WalK [Anaerolineae bacterium]|nr:cell wall metabolism sensor histidine kinase WalK [Anaerolineae bacterium]
MSGSVRSSSARPTPRPRGITGTGLGVAIAKQLIGTFGGRLSVQSVIGEGTTFTVALPLHGRER